MGPVILTCISSLPVILTCISTSALPLAAAVVFFSLPGAACMSPPWLQLLRLSLLCCAVAGVSLRKGGLSCSLVHGSWNSVCCCYYFVQPNSGSSIKRPKTLKFLQVLMYSLADKQHCHACGSACVQVSATFVFEHRMLSMLLMLQ